MKNIKFASSNKLISVPLIPYENHQQIINPSSITPRRQKSQQASFQTHLSQSFQHEKQLHDLEPESCQENEG